MKFILILSICSSLTGTCQTIGIPTERFDTWSECVKAGAEQIIKTTETFEDKFNKQRLVVSYFCNEDHSNKTTT
tara:strand:+ start:410 stop:631 length:222 start_codon:yes stop_codon:yes gene_type:complete